MKMPECETITSGGWISSDWLWNQLRGGNSSNEEAPPDVVRPNITVLDCRPAADFSDCHIRRAVHLVLPTIMLRRLAGGKVTINTVLKSSENGMLIGGGGGKKQQHTFVLCGSGELTAVLTKSLIQDGCPVVCLQGGVEEFREKYPEWCVTRETENPAGSSGGSEDVPNLRLASDVNNRPQRLSSSSSSNTIRRPGSLGSRSASDSEEDRPDSSLESNDIRAVDDAHLNGPPEFGSGFSLGLSVGLRLGLESEPLPPLVLDSVEVNPIAGGLTGAIDSSVDPLADPGFPVEILPHLFLGNAQNSRDCDALDKHHIRYVVNVTPNLPNVFEDSGSIQYLQIPITDHWSENLASFFPSAIHFIDGARERQEGVLVHCLAGISRSVTITVAYLMYKMSMSLNDAYDFVRRKKSNISPNFNFMGQLLDFERQLNPPSPQRCTCGGSKTDPSAVLPFTRLSIEEKDEDEEATIPDDSGIPSSVSLSPCSAGSSLASSPALLGGSSSTASGVKRLRTLVCRCQASLAQCHFTSPM